MARAPRPEDLYDLRIPTDLDLSPDGRFVAFSVKSVAPGKDGYRSSLWLAPADGSAPARQLTVGSKNDTTPRWSPDGSRLAFLSDRGAVLQAGGGGARAGKPEAPKEGGTQVWILPFADGGEARQLTDLPKDVEGLDWSPDGRRLAVVSTADSTEPEKKPERKPEDGPAPDTRLIDTLSYQFNGAGFVHERFTRLWLVDADSGAAELLTRGNHHDADPQWSPDGRQIAFVSDRHPNPDLGWRSDIYLVDVRGGTVRQLSPGRGRQGWGAPSWSPDGRWVAADRDARLAARRPAAGIGLALPRSRRRGREPAPGRRSRGGRRHEQRPHGRSAGAPGLDGRRPLGRLLGARRRLLRAVAGRGRRRADRAADPRPALPRAADDRRRCPAAAHAWRSRASPRRARPEIAVGDVPAGRLSGHRSGRAAPGQRPHARVGRHQARRAGRALARGRRPPHPGLVHLGAGEHEAEPRAGRARDPRRPGHALRLVADVGVAAAGRQRDQRLRLQPARLAGLRLRLPQRERPRLGRRTDARRHGRTRLAHRGRPRRRRSDGRHRRLVRRLPHLVDRRPHRSVQGGGDLPIGQRHDQPDAVRATSAGRSSASSSTASTRGRTGISTTATRR